MKDINEHDELGELFRLRLENHETPVDGDGWNEIEQRLNKRKNKAAIWLWGGGLAAAATIAALLMVGKPMTDESYVHIVSQHVAETETPITTAIITETNPETSIETNIVSPPATTQIAVATPTTQENQPAESVTPLLPSASLSEFSYSVTETDPVTETNSVTPLLSYSATETDPVTPPLPSASPLRITLIDDDDYDETVTGKTGKWLLAAGFGTGYGTINIESGGVFADLFGDQRKSSSMEFWGNNAFASDMSGSILLLNNYSKESFSNITHYPPFSFGLRIQSLGENAGFESGIMYSYLSSFFEWERSNYTARQRLHYIGIPVNLIGYFGKNSKSTWRFYISGGFMVEKGLRAVYSQEVRDWTSIRTTTVESSIDGFHWSLNSALGVKYRIERGFSIFLEPRIGYYLKSEQPISIRTETPLYFGINFGLNYEL